MVRNRGVAALGTHSSSRLKLLACFVAVAALLPMSAVSAAVPTRDWTPEELVTSYGDDNSTWVRPEYLVGSAADGTAVAIWEHKQDTGKTIELSRRPTGGSWTTPVVVASVPKSTWLGEMVVDAAGDVTFTMQRVRVAVDTYETFVQTVSANGDIGQRHLSPGTYLVGNGRGDVMAISNNQVQTSYIFRPAGGQWSDPANGPSPTGLWTGGRPQLNMDSDGKVQWVGVFIREPTSQRKDQIGLTTWSPSTKVWSKLQFVTGIGPGLENLYAAGNNSGDLVVGWTEVYDDQEGYLDEAVKSMFIPNGAATPRPIKTWAHQDNCWQRAQMIGVGIDAASNASVTWKQCETDGSANSVINSARRLSAVGSWSAPETVADGTRFFEGHYEVNGHGTAMLLYRQVPDFELVTARRSPDGQFGVPTVLTPPGGQLSNRTVMDLSPTSTATILYSYYKQHPVYSRTFE